VIVVVSEETQEISIVKNGVLTTQPDEINLVNSLRDIFIEKEGPSHSWKSWFLKK